MRALRKSQREWMQVGAGALLGLVVLAAGVTALVYLTDQAGQVIERVDDSGGLSALVDRVWRGKPQ